MVYRQYPKIHRIGKDEVTGILDLPVIVQEKIDGANSSIFWLDGEIRFGTRTRMLPLDESFRGFNEWVQEHKGKIAEWFNNGNQDKILYGEWLVKHTLEYPKDRYEKFYLFDIYDKVQDKNLSQTEVKQVAEQIGAEYPEIFAEGKFSLDQIKEYVGKSAIAPKGEGVVIKNIDFVNQFGDHCYAKIVTSGFQEKNNILFGNNNKSSPVYTEMAIVNNYISFARVKKVIQKLESLHNRPMRIEDSGMVAGSVYHDMLTEEIWDIQKKYRAVDFNALRRIGFKRSIVLFHDILENGISSLEADK